MWLNCSQPVLQKGSSPASDQSWSSNQAAPANQQAQPASNHSHTHTQNRLGHTQGHNTCLLLQCSRGAREESVWTSRYLERRWNWSPQLFTDWTKSLLDVASSKLGHLPLQKGGPGHNCLNCLWHGEQYPSLFYIPPCQLPQIYSFSLIVICSCFTCTEIPRASASSFFCPSHMD